MFASFITENVQQLMTTTTYDDYNLREKSAEELKLNYFGNELLLRETFASADFYRTVVDESVIPEEGVLKSFSIFIHPERRTLDAADGISLQIWTLLSPDTYQLKWQTELKQADLPHPDVIEQSLGWKFVYNVSRSVAIRVTPGDRMGFTCVGRGIPVSLELDHRSSCRYMTYEPEDQDYPSTLGNYTFDSIVLPAMFSMGIALVGL